MVRRQMGLAHGSGLYVRMRFPTIRSSAAYKNVEPDASCLPRHQDPQQGTHVSQNKLPKLDTGRIVVRIQRFREIMNQEKGINVGLKIYEALCETTT